LLYPFFLEQNEWKIGSKLFDNTGSKYLKISPLDIIKYHFNIHGDNWFLLNAKLRESQKRDQELEKEKNVIQQMLDKLEEYSVQNQFNYDLDVFKHEIQSLVENAKQICIEQDKYKRTILNLNNTKTEKEIKLKHLKECLLDSSKDIEKYKSGEIYYCEACHSEVNFSDLVATIQNKEELGELINEIDQELIDVGDEIIKLYKTLEASNNKYNNIIETFTIRKNQVDFHTVCKSVGLNDLRNLRKQELGEIGLKLDAINKEIKKYKKEIKDLNIDEVDKSRMDN
jgi:hypothetical protein